MKIFTPIRLQPHIREIAYTYAESHNLIWRGRLNLNAAIEELIVKGWNAEQAGGEKPRMQVHVKEDTAAIEKEILRLLNRGLEPWKVAEKVGNIELVDKIYRKLGEWMQVRQLEVENQRLRSEIQALKYENYQLRVDFECAALEITCLTRVRTNPYMCRLLISIVNQCHMNRTLPSKMIENMFGVSLLKFIKSIGESTGRGGLNGPEEPRFKCD